MADRLRENADDITSEASSRKHTQQFLGNENIFLAWLRTGLTLMSFGFVVNQFGIWLEGVGHSVSSQSEPAQSVASVRIGIGMVFFGGLLCVLAAWRYFKVYREIEQGNFQPDRGLVWLVTALTIILTIVMVIFMFASSRQF